MDACGLAAADSDAGTKENLYHQKASVFRCAMAGSNSEVRTHQCGDIYRYLSPIFYRVYRVLSVLLGETVHVMFVRAVQSPAARTRRRTSSAVRPPSDRAGLDPLRAVGATAARRQRRRACNGRRPPVRPPRSTMTPSTSRPPRSEAASTPACSLAGGAAHVGMWLFNHDRK